MATPMKVALVAADREVWSGEATVVNARTVDGELGVLAHHTPMMSVLATGVVEVETVDEGRWVAAVDGGFISVANNEVRLLCERAEVSEDGNAEEAQRLLDERIGTQDDDDDKDTQQG